MLQEMMTFKDFQKRHSNRSIQWQLPVSSLMFNIIPDSTVRGPMIPITKKRMADIMSVPTEERAIHVTDVDGLMQLIETQNSKKSISVATHANAYFLKHGVWRNGVICLMEGDMLLAGDTDIMSIPDKSGIRWISVSYTKRRVENGGLSELEDHMDELYKNIMSHTVAKPLKKYLQQLDPNIYMHGWIKTWFSDYERRGDKTSGDIRLMWRYLGDLFNSLENDRVVRGIFQDAVKRFMKEIESIYRIHRYHFQDLIRANQNERVGYSGYHEGIMSNYRIVKGYIVPLTTSGDTIDYLRRRGILRKYNLKVLEDNVQDMIWQDLKADEDFWEIIRK